MASEQKKKPLSPPFYFGGVASCAAAFITHPLDLTKVRLQMNTGSTQSGKMVQTMINIVRNEGILAIYNGLSASILRQLTYSTARFGSYEKIKGIISSNGKQPGFWGMLFSSVAAGAIGGVVGNPADVINVRMQNDGKLPPDQRRNYKNAIDGVIRITRDEGVTSLARGIGPNVNRAMLMTAGQLVSYDVFKAMLLKQKSLFRDNLTTHFLASLLAGLVATTICSPVDVIKTRIMGQSKDKSDVKKVGSLRMMFDIARMEGPMALFKGWTPAFIRLGPHTIITFVVLEQMKQAYFKMHQPKSVK